MPRQAASAFFLLSSLSSLELSFVIVAVIIIYSTRKQSSSLSVACLLAYLLAAAISLFLPVAAAIFFKGIHCNFSSSCLILASFPPLFSLGSVNCRDSYKSSNA